MIGYGFVINFIDIVFLCLDIWGEIVEMVNC